MTNPDQDQTFANLNQQLDVVVNGARRSNKRKMHRHGKNYDADMAAIDSVNIFHKMDHQTLAVLAGMAVQRLAKMPDYVPVPVQIAALDFDVDLDAIMSELSASSEEMATEDGQQVEQEDQAPLSGDIHTDGQADPISLDDDGDSTPEGGSE